VKNDFWGLVNFFGRVLTGKPVFFPLKTGYLWRFKIAGSPQTNEDTEDQTESRRLPESMLKSRISVIASVIFKKS
jgi:hypothetical protein